MGEDDFLEAAYEDRIEQEIDLYNGDDDEAYWDDIESRDSDIDHDAWVFASAGMGTDEDYGFFGGDDDSA